MKAFVTVPLATVLALALIGWIVLGRGDRTVLVSPPEAVAESFMRELTAQRPWQARQYLSTSAESTIDEAALEGVTRDVLSRTRGVLNVETHTLAMQGDMADAAAALVPRQGDTLRFELPLVRESGGWKVAGVATRKP